MSSSTQDAEDTAAEDTAAEDTASGADTGGPPCETAADCAVDPCLDAACIAGHCATSPKANGSPCPVLTPCATGGACKAGSCEPVGTKTCDDDNPCTVDGCDAATGACTFKPNPGVTCNDGNPCTKSDACSPAGACVGGKNVCTGCTSLKDCAAYDDGNPCNGTLYCHVEPGAQGVCEVLPSSVVVCDPAGDKPCLDAACDPQAGTCTLVAQPDGTACDDGRPCTQQEACQGGACTAAANVCQCESDGDCAAYDDGDACTGTLYCDTAGLPHTCKVLPTSVVSCATSTDPCKVNACDPKSGACKSANAVDGVACTDGDPKTVGDVCVSGVCKPGVDTSVCKTDVDCVPLEDGDFCNGTLFCNAATGQCQLNPATVVHCASASDTACRANVCETATGVCAMKPLPNGIPCDDGNKCTVGEVCKAGVCTASADTCQCKSDADCGKLEDGDACNGTLYCDSATNQCVVNPATVVTCPTAFDTACRVNSCDKASGTCALQDVVDGKPCNDGNACTVGEVCDKGACVASADACACKVDKDCAAFEDGNSCNGTLYCDKQLGACKLNPASLVVCPDAFDTACLENQCDPATGQCAKVAVNQGSQCDADGNPCTASDSCDAGVCKPGALVCDCQKDTDCVGKQGADKCVLGMYCDLSKNECAPTKVVQCDVSGDGPCKVTACDPKTGTCQQSDRPDGEVCEGNTLCTGAQICDGGSCVTGKAVNCDDINPCTSDTCDAKQGGCLHKALNAVSCDDGSACTSDDGCVEGTCLGTAASCNDNEVCTKDACDPLSGCVFLPVGATVCDDDDPCTLGDTCKTGACVGGQGKLTCDDGNPCTFDTCKAKLGCAFDAKPLAGSLCDDGDVCTHQDSCKGGACAGLTKSCDDGEPCTTDVCIKGKGCVHDALQKGTCDDGDACTKGDSCKTGTCVGALVVDCDDQEPCTVDTCDKKSGCGHVALANASKCSDKNPCTSKDSCKQGKCVGAAVSCNDDNVCTVDACDPDLGKCVYLPSTVVACQDNNPCTVTDVCKGGVCTGGKAKTCDDANSCTLDNCTPSQGCVHQGLVGTTCDDGSVCTSGEVCVNGACKGSEKSCDDNNSCTADSCDLKAGCVHVTKVGTACNDNNACTANDSCSQKKCVGKPVSCDDGNSCTEDVCDEASGCKKKILDKVPCDDGSACTEGDVCVSGICKAKEGLWLKKFSLNSGPEYHNAAALDSTGAIVIVGSHRVGDSLNNDGLDRYVTRIDATGKQLYFSSPANTGDDSYYAVAAGTEGEVYCAGQSETKNFLYSSKNIFIARVNSAGAEVWSKKQGSPDYGRAIATIGGNRIAVLGTTSKDSSLLIMNRSDGAIVTTTKVAGSGVMLRGMAAAGDKSFLLAGHASNKSTLFARQYGIDASLAWSKSFAATTGQDEEVYGAAFVGGGPILGGRATLNGTAYPLLVRLSPSGDLVWKRVVTALADSSLRWANPLADGGALAGGSGGSFLRVSPAGHVAWHRRIQVNDGFLVFRGGGLRSDGTLLLGGLSQISQVPDAAVARVDRWGNLTCSKSGSCITQPLSKCDDKNPCTLDVCGAPGGCTHAPVQDGVACGANGTCTSGVCK